MTDQTTTSQDESAPQKKKGSWVGTGVPGPGRSKNPYFVTYEEACAWARQLGIDNYETWRKFAKLRFKKGEKKGLLIRGRMIPAAPFRVYPECSARTFLGHEKHRYTYEQVREYARQLHASGKVNSQEEWIKWVTENQPKHIPQRPHRAFVKEWTGWVDFLGKKPETKLTYSQVKAYAQSKRFRVSSEWKQHVRSMRPQPNGRRLYPIRPERTFADEWEGWATFLGISATTKLSAATTLITITALSYSFAPGNVVRLVIDASGLVARSAVENDDARVVAVCEVPQARLKEVKDLIDRSLAVYSQYDDPEWRIMPDPHRFLSYIQQAFTVPQ